MKFDREQRLFLQTKLQIMIDGLKNYILLIETIKDSIAADEVVDIKLKSDIQKAFEMKE